MARDQRLLPWRQIGVEVGQRLRRLVLDSRNLIADVAAGRGECAQLVDLGLEFGNGFFEVEIAAHLIRHQSNIGNNAPRGEAVSIRSKKARIFNDLARNRSGLAGFIEDTPSRAADGRRLFRGRRRRSQGAPLIESYFSASGCRSRTRLFRRSSTTWV